MKLPAGAAIAILLAAAVFFAFFPVLHNGFTGYDDSDYVTGNPHVTGGPPAANLAWAFTHSYAGNWHPLTWISHALDCALYGLHPAGHHLTSLLLHVANTLLLFVWLAWLTGARARGAFVALAFGLHPLHVESAAWIAERKDVLSTFFALAALLAYTAYARRPSLLRYLAVALLFAASLASKAMWMTLPLLLLLIDWWPLGRRAIREKIPFFLLAALASAAAFWAQSAGAAVTALDRLPLSLRLSNAALSYLRYLAKTAWPLHLAAFYPFPDSIPAWRTALALLALAAITALAIHWRASHPWIAVGWGWYVVMLLPVIGIVQVGMQSMADRYMYGPLIGLAIAIVWSVPDGAAVRAAAFVLMAAWAVLSWRQCLVWRDGVTLWEHAAAVTSGNFVAHDNLGVELDRRGRPEEALAEYRQALRLRPADRNASENVAQACFSAGARLIDQARFAEAVDRFREGLQLRPRNALAHSYLAIALASLGRYREALDSVNAALRLDPQQEIARRARAQLLPLVAK